MDTAAQLGLLAFWADLIGLTFCVAIIVDSWMTRDRIKRVQLAADNTEIDAAAEKFRDEAKQIRQSQELRELTFFALVIFSIMVAFVGFTLGSNQNAEQDKYKHQTLYGNTILSSGQHVEAAYTPFPAT